MGAIRRDLNEAVTRGISLQADGASHKLMSVHLIAAHEAVGKRWTGFLLGKNRLHRGVQNERERDTTVHPRSWIEEKGEKSGRERHEGLFQALI